MSREFGICGQIVIDGGGIKLAPDLTFPASATFGTTSPSITITGIDASSGLTTLVSLVGKFAVSFMLIGNATIENITLKLTIDGVPIWNDTMLSGSTLSNLVGDLGDNATNEFICDSSLLLEAQTLTDTSIDFTYLARPIL